jgi:hypothetical protein
MDLVINAIIGLIAGLLGGAVIVIVYIRFFQNGLREEQKGTFDEARIRTQLQERIAKLDKDLREALKGRDEHLYARLQSHTEELTRYKEKMDREFRTLNKNIDVLSRRPDQQQAEPPAAAGPPPAAPARRGVDQSRHRKHATAELPSHDPAARVQIAPEAPAQTGPRLRAEPQPSPREIIVRNFDEIDAKTMRRIEDMRVEYRARLGKWLEDLTEQNGAYVFAMGDGTAYVHPKPNSPLPQYWERAFPGAESYSRPLSRIEAPARVRMRNDGEYEVIERGGFQVS